MAKFTQENRRIKISTPLGEDVLLLQSVSGQESISRLFHFSLGLHSENPAIAFESIVGQRATVSIALNDGSDRYINGIISSFTQGGSIAPFTSYHATLVPWLWLLTRTSDCRIFQNMTVPDIIQQVFSDAGFSDVKSKLYGSYQPREYCVQYRETSFNFVSRLMEEEGIFYFFDHESDKHTLVMGDRPNAFVACPLQPKINYANVAEQKTGVYVSDLSINQEVVPGKYSFTDFNFEKPSTDLSSTIEGKDKLKYEIYDYPGEYETRDDGDRLAAIRMQEHDSAQMTLSGSSNAQGFVAGFKFDLKNHYRRDVNDSYVITSIHHSADQGMNYRSTGSDGSHLDYSNHFQCVKDKILYRPARVTPSPIIQGSQTAIVVGPANEEIYVDKYGRVKVQFHWDRVGKYDEKSSCWIRVSQNWAGKKWGAIFLPRIGQEVIVDFIEGDPDRPIITGRVYNANAMPPYDLPAESTKSTIKSLSSKGGGGFNELRFEDKKGKEQIFIHAEKNHDMRVKNDSKEWIGHNTHLIVGKDQFEKVGGDKHLTIKGDQNEKVTGTVSLDAGMDIQRKAGMKYGLDAGQEIHLKAGMTVVIEAGVSLTLKVGGNFVNLSPAGVAISGTMVMINSGGSAGSGSGSSPQPPKDPMVADDDKAGSITVVPPKKKSSIAPKYSAAAAVLKKAAKTGTPFCAVCAAGQ